MNQCIIATSYIYTYITVITSEEIVLYSKLIKNIEFQKIITTILDTIKNNFKIEFYTIFTGPAPLLSLRATLSFIKGFMLVSLQKNNLKFILVGGNECYWDATYDIIIIQNFSHKFTVLYSENHYEEYNQNELFEIVNKYKKIGLVVRDNFKIKFHSYTGIILHPNISYLFHQGIYKYKSSKWINTVDQITLYKDENQSNKK